MKQIFIYSDNKALINSWSSALSSAYLIDTIEEVGMDINAETILVDYHKVDNDERLFSFFSKPTTRYLIIGTGWPEEKQIKALVHGAVGYCGEYEPAKLLIQAVECILKGDLWIQRHLVPQVIGTLVQLNSSSQNKAKKSNSAASSELLKTLSIREMDVANMIRAGESNKTIATTLNISERTVKAHLTSTYKKLNVSDRLHLALYIKEFS